MKEVKDFVKQYEKVIGMLTRENEDNIYRSLYYYDNPYILKKHQYFINHL